MFLFKRHQPRPTRDPLFNALLSGNTERVDMVLESREENAKRRKWFSDRMWHNGRHCHCCKRCLQAGYVMALLAADRLDLLSEYPELIIVYEELKRDGMLQLARTD